MSVKKMLLAVTVGAALFGGALAAEAAEVKSKFFLHTDYYLSDAGTATTVAAHEFIVRRARVAFDAKIDDLVSAVLVLQADDSGTGARTATLKDGNVAFKLSPMALVRAGISKYEFDLEGRESSTVRPFLNRSIVTNAVAGGLTGASGDFRDKGVSVTGKSSAFGYGLGLWQGQGASARDNNDKFGYTANVWGKLAAVKLNVGYMSSDNATPAGATNKFSASTVGVAYDPGAWIARVEYYSGKREAAASQDLTGYYVMGAYTMTETVDLMARYQSFEDEKWGTADNAVTSADLGVKYYFARKGRAGNSIAVNYMVRSADKGVTQKIFDERGANLKGDNIDNVLMARLQVQF